MKKVDVVGSETLQTMLDGIENVLPAEAIVVDVALSVLLVLRIPSCVGSAAFTLNHEVHLTGLDHSAFDGMPASEPWS